MYTTPDHKPTAAKTHELTAKEQRTLASEIKRLCKQRPRNGDDLMSSLQTALPAIAPRLTSANVQAVVVDLVTRGELKLTPDDEAQP